MIYSDFHAQYIIDVIDVPKIIFLVFYYCNFKFKIIDSKVYLF